MYNELLRLAKDKLASIEEEVTGLPAPQVTVLVTQGCTYYAVNDPDGHICGALKQDGNTNVLRMISVLKPGTVDIAPYKFRKAIMALDERNANTDVILQGFCELNGKKLSVTL